MNINKNIVAVLAIVLNLFIGFSQTNSYTKPEWGEYTVKDGVLFAHISKWPADGKLVIDRAIKPREARLLSEPSKKMKIKLIDDKLQFFYQKKLLMLRCL